jgi:hypothetical protein
MRNPSSFLSSRGNCEGNPLSPPVGEAVQGGKPPDPMSGWIFLLRCRRTIRSHTPRGEPRWSGERPWPFRNPIPVPSFCFLKSMISTEQFFNSLSPVLPVQRRIPPELYPSFEAELKNLKNQVLPVTAGIPVLHQRVPGRAG